MKAGEIYWVTFPARGGHEQAGRRPAIILQGASASALLPTVLVVPLTTQLDALRFPGTVLIETSSQNRLPRPSAALVFQLTAIDRRQVGNHLGNLNNEELTAIWTTLDAMGERTLTLPGDS